MRIHVALAPDVTSHGTTRSCSALGRANIGEITVNWLALSWISTNILGVPIINAAYGVAMSVSGIWAGISSFIFQLPVRAAAALSAVCWSRLSNPSPCPPPNRACC